MLTERTSDLPDDLSSLSEKMEAVERFGGKLPDNVLIHTQRAVAIAQEYLPENDDLQRMLWVHDIPEIIIGDVVMPDKISTMGDEDLAEIEAARQLLNTNDFELFVKFKNAERFLHDGEIENPDHTGILANVIDKVQGNITYHRYASQTGDHFFKEAYDYTNNQKQKFENLFDTLPPSEELATAIKILADQMDYINKLWEK